MALACALDKPRRLAAAAWLHVGGVVIGLALAGAAHIAARGASTV